MGFCQFKQLENYTIGINTLKFRATRYDVILMDKRYIDFLRVVLNKIIDIKYLKKILFREKRF